jgi:hypothetical protein
MKPSQRIAVRASLDVQQQAASGADEEIEVRHLCQFCISCSKFEGWVNASAKLTRGIFDKVKDR